MYLDVKDEKIRQNDNGGEDTMKTLEEIVL